MQINLINVLTNTGQGYMKSIFAYQMLAFLTVQFPFPRGCIMGYKEGQIMDVLCVVLIMHTPVAVRM